VEQEKLVFKIADIVKESYLIVPSDRAAWTGLVLGIEHDAWVFNKLYNLQTQDRVVVLWLDTGLIEELPCSVLLLEYREEE
tara:strand:- start:1425 stop:1667 length:243 start_codon:yes stop_codon:yes gene_type:complete